MKTALTIDGNYLLNKDVFILFGLKTLHQDLLNLLVKDMDTLKKMYAFDKIYFVSDSKKGYWRKQIYSDYKQNRVKNENIDWTWVYNEFNTFIDILKEDPKIEVINIDYAEGDDVIANIIDRNNKLGYSNLIVASDVDIQQKAKFDLSLNYINFMYNYKFSDERIYLPQNYNVFINEFTRNASSTLFDMNDSDEFINFLSELINRTKVKEVLSEEILFTKIVSGDSGDNITSVFEKLTSTGKKMGIGKNGAQSIYNLYKETYKDDIDFDSEEFVEKLSEMVCFSKKIDLSNSDGIKSKIKRNRKLIKLTENYLPDHLVEILNETIKI